MGNTILRRTFFASVLLLSSSAAFALYDAQPDETLASVQGAWQGTLTYRDYSKPDKFVTLPTKLFIALAGPNELVLHYVFDDGPNKKVYSYERMEIDFSTNRMIWATGEKPAPALKVISMSGSGNARQIIFERQDKEHIARYLLQISPTEIRFNKDEVSAQGEVSFRNRYEFKRNVP